MKENESAHFMCKVHPDDSPVSWFIGSDEVIDSSRYKIYTVLSERHLQINKVQKRDEDVVTARVGKYESTANLFVKGTDLTLFFRPFNVVLVKKTKKYFLICKRCDNVIQEEI